VSTETVIFIGVGLYILVMLGVGVYASRRTHTVTEFIVAGRGLPLWVCSATVLATWFGGGTMMGTSGSAYQHGMIGVIADPLGSTLALFLVGFFFARLFRRMRILTVADYMAQRYGQVAAMAITLVTIFSNVMWVAGLLVAFGLIFESLTGTPMLVGVLGGALVIVVYTAIGGLWAVALTDFLQMIIIIVGLVVLLTVVLIDVGGWGAVASRLPEGTFQLIPGENTAEQHDSGAAGNHCERDNARPRRPRSRNPDAGYRAPASGRGRDICRCLARRHHEFGG
jgi:Na+/proline symporter